MSAPLDGVITRDGAVPPRLRFAPSPTGMFHVGSARSALFNWLYARRLGGTLVLRIEDTDAERNRPEWIDGILEAMRWLGLDWDEGPNFQSGNINLHLEAGERLFASGNAYFCDCTREAIDQRAADAGKRPGYDGFCRERSLGAGEGRVLRFRVPEGTTTVHDLVRGDVVFENSNIEDFVVVRSNGTPMFLLANAVDDITEHITHVVRGEEHLPNTPKQLLMWRVLAPGVAPPTYAHLPVIVNEKRQKLSKRRDKVSLEMYRDEGFLPDAMRNYLALLGWAPKGDREVVSLQTLIDEFDFVDVQKSSAFFDIAKLTHFNGEYIRALELHAFVELAWPFVERANFPKCDKSKFENIAALVQERVARLDEVPAMVDFLFIDTVIYDTDAMKIMQKQGSVEVLRDAIAAFAACEWSVNALHQAALQVGEQHGLKLGKAQAPLRLAVTGKKVGPPLFDAMVLLGREETLARFRNLATAIGMS